MTEQPLPMTDPSSRLAASRAAFAALHPRVAAGSPWPLAEHFGTEPEASWGPREVLAHTAEMLPYWLGEFERLVEAGRGQEMAFPSGAPRMTRSGSASSSGIGRCRSGSCSTGSTPASIAGHAESRRLPRATAVPWACMPAWAR